MHEIAIHSWRFERQLKSCPAPAINVLEILPHTHTMRQNLKIDKEIFLEETEVKIFAISNNLQSFYSVANLVIFDKAKKILCTRQQIYIVDFKCWFLKIKDQQCNFVYIWIAYTALCIRNISGRRIVPTPFLVMATSVKRLLS